MAGKPFSFGPVAVPNATADLLNPGTTTGGVNCTAAPNDKLAIEITHMRVVNKTAGAVAMSMFIGGTGGEVAGTEFAWAAESVPANNHLDWYGKRTLSTTQFLTHKAGAATSLTIEGEGTIGVA